MTLGQSEESEERLLTVSDVARFMNVHQNSVRYWSDMGLLRCYRIGRRGDRRFRPDDVDAFLALRRNR